MDFRRSWTGVTMGVIGAMLGFGPAARGSLIWSGDPSKGASVFKLLNLEDADKNAQPNPSANGSSITAGTDPTYGADWQFSKATPDLRAEAHGANGFTPAVGNTYYLGWRFKVNSTVSDNAVFQWKTFGATDAQPSTQNFPLILSFNSGALQLAYYSPGEVRNLLWSQTEAANQWFTVALRIDVEADTTGSVSFWFNGVQQTLTGGVSSYAAKTFDGTSVDPKWGIYGAVGTQVTNDVTALRIGTTLADVTPVPEPGTVGVIALVSVGMLGGRRRGKTSNTQH